MARPRRIAIGNIVYHVLNRANGRLHIFKKPRDFEAFEEILAQGCERFDMRLCGYCIMNNHWHLILWPRHDGDLSEFMKWITVTHSGRWHTSHGTVGIGHVYQGRFKSFPVQSNSHYLTLMRYVESNPLRANIVKQSKDWPWSSLAVRTGVNKPISLNQGPISLPQQWPRIVDRTVNIPEKDRKILETCIKRGTPLGQQDWIIKTAATLGLQSTISPKGRPKNTPQLLK